MLKYSSLRGAGAGKLLPLAVPLTEPLPMSPLKQDNAEARAGLQQSYLPLVT